jgi:hypothetical protein
MAPMGKGHAVKMSRIWCCPATQASLQPRECTPTQQSSAPRNWLVITHLRQLGQRRPCRIPPAGLPVRLHGVTGRA